MNWFVLALLSTLLYGIWGFLTKLATRHIDSYNVLVFQTIGCVIIGFVVYGKMGLKVQWHAVGVAYAVILGVIGMLATLLFVEAVKEGNLMIVTTISSLYPFITIVLAFFFLKESMTPRQVAGLVLSVVAVLLLIE